MGQNEHGEKAMSLFNGVQSTLVFLVLLMSMVAMPATAQIYKWVDANGKVHFSDKPREQDAGGQEEEIELEHNYVPSDDGLAARQLAQRKRALDSLEQDRAQEQAAKEKEAKQKQAACKKMQDKLDRLTYGGRVENGQRYKTDYFVDDNGKAISQKQQDEIVAKYRKELNKLCR